MHQGLRHLDHRLFPSSICWASRWRCRPTGQRPHWSSTSPEWSRPPARQSWKTEPMSLVGFKRVVLVIFPTSTSSIQIQTDIDTIYSNTFTGGEAWWCSSRRTQTGSLTLSVWCSAAWSGPGIKWRFYHSAHSMAIFQRTDTVVDVVFCCCWTVNDVDNVTLLSLTSASSHWVLIILISDFLAIR